MDDGHVPASKADLTAVKNEVLGAMHDCETRLLKAFYDFAESNQKRLAATETIGAATVERLGSIERRVTDIEKWLNLPSAS
jgi:hypothetical protein